MNQIDDKKNINVKWLPVFESHNSFTDTCHDLGLTSVKRFESGKGEPPDPLPGFSRQVVRVERFSTQTFFVTIDVSSPNNPDLLRILEEAGVRIKGVNL